MYAAVLLLVAGVAGGFAIGSLGRPRRPRTCPGIELLIGNADRSFPLFRMDSVTLHQLARLSPDEPGGDWTTLHSVHAGGLTVQVRACQLDWPEE